MITPTEVQGGVDLDSLRPGSLIEIETKSRHYYIEYLGGKAMRISGHPEYCPEPVRALVESPIEPGRRLTFLLNDNRPVTTTVILNLRVEQPATVPPASVPSIN